LSGEEQSVITMKKKDNPEGEVAILLTDMKQYAKLPTSG
jgi:hypothetical protein